MKKLAKKKTGGEEPKSKSINVKVSSKMGNLDGSKIRANQKLTGNNYTFSKTKPGSMSGSDSSYVNRFSKGNFLSDRKTGGAIKTKKK
jgi:hypothetical protein